MRYMLSIYGDEQRWAQATPEETRATLARYEAFGKEAGERIVAGDGLQPTVTATTVRVRDGDRLLADGPFTETKEQLGGFYVLECADLDEALDWAAKIPGAHTGAIEVRPVMDYETVDAPGDRAEEAPRPA
ncbi:MAG TPA: YciI family protein [Thermoleophilaceae bacterium]|jgi:hypothetical protein|nr:YciI family protein [Thermoleophilaceae bacterium]